MTHQGYQAPGSAGMPPGSAGGYGRDQGPAGGYGGPPSAGDYPPPNEGMRHCQPNDYCQMNVGGRSMEFGRQMTGLLLMILNRQIVGHFKPSSTMRRSPVVELFNPSLRRGSPFRWQVARLRSCAADSIRGFRSNCRLSDDLAVIVT